MNVTYMNIIVQHISRALHLVKLETLYQLPIISLPSPWKSLFYFLFL